MVLVIWYLSSGHHFFTFGTTQFCLVSCSGRLKDVFSLKLSLVFFFFQSLGMHNVPFHCRSFFDLQKVTPTPHPIALEFLSEEGLGMYNCKNMFSKGCSGMLSGHLSHYCLLMLFIVWLEVSCIVSSKTLWVKCHKVCNKYYSLSIARLLLPSYFRYFPIIFHWNLLNN